MRARLLYREKFIYADGAIREMVLWQLPLTSGEKTAALKYRLLYGTADGTGLLRYDNEKGKGHHRHALDLEGPYRFTDVDGAPREVVEPLASFGADLRFLLIVSGFELLEAPEMTVEVLPADGTKCERCRNWTEDVGRDAEFPTICAHCAAAVRA